jgi:hypothetical protein
MSSDEQVSRATAAPQQYIWQYIWQVPENVTIFI